MDTIDDGAGHFTLQREHIVDHPLEGALPERRIGGGENEPRVDPNASLDIGSAAGGDEQADPSSTAST